MGEAKRRGTKEQRIAKAKDAKAAVERAVDAGRPDLYPHRGRIPMPLLAAMVFGLAAGRRK